MLAYLRVLAGGRPLGGSERYRPFFIVGSGRSGTTLLRAMLEAHPVVHIPPEAYVLGKVAREYRRYSRLPWNVLLRIVLGAFEYDARWETFNLTLGSLFRELQSRPPGARDLAAVLDALYRAHARRHKPSATRWGDKNPHHSFYLPVLREMFPDLQVIHILRDGRDVVRSYMRMQSMQSGLAHFAAHWLHAVRSVQRFGARYPHQYLELRYEDLVREPRAMMEAVAAFLHLDFDDRMLRHHALDLRLGDVERYPHLTGVREPVYQTSIGRWRSEFDAAQIAELERLLGSTLAVLGYGDAGHGIATGATPRGLDR